MKKALALILALVICLSVCACDSNKTNDTDDTKTVENTTEPIENTTESKKELTAESVAGTYKTTMWFLDETITLNSNTTYTSSNGSKGTFSIISSNIIVLKPVDNPSAERRFRYTEDGLIDFDDWIFEKDEEFGLVFTPNENGLTEQTFEDCLINGKLPGCDYNWFVLLLKMDGSFELRTGKRYTTSIDIKDVFNGTYTYTDSKLTLSYDGQEYTMLVGDNSFIQFHILEKI